MDEDDETVSIIERKEKLHKVYEEDAVTSDDDSSSDSE
jgi:hypothetical protein